MSLSDELFDALLILVWLATPLVWAGTLFFQSRNRPGSSYRPSSGLPTLTSVLPNENVSALRNREKTSRQAKAGEAP